jgi:two-component system, NarL family, response regulator YdfI
MLQITPSERSALELLANGSPMGEIAASLGVRVREVGAHLTSLFLRMGVTDETEAVAAALRRGLVTNSDESMATKSANSTH